MAIKGGHDPKATRKSVVDEMLAGFGLTREAVASFFKCGVVENFHAGTVPHTWEQLMKLPSIEEYAAKGRRVVEMPYELVRSAVAMPVIDFLSLVFEGIVTVEPAGNQTPCFVMDSGPFQDYCRLHELKSKTSFVAFNPSKPEHAAYSFSPSAGTAIMPATLRRFVAITAAYGNLDINALSKDDEEANADANARFSTRCVIVKVRPAPQ